jgi:hypothetical protein
MENYITREKDYGYGMQLNLLYDSKNWVIADLIKELITMAHSFTHVEIDYDRHGEVILTPYNEETEQSYQNRCNLEKAKAQKRSDAAKRTAITREKNLLIKLKNKYEV